MRALRIRSALLLATALAAVPLALAPMQPARAQISIGLDIGIAPPPLPVYEQPALPAQGYLWQPGYWSYGDYGYYWVPGTWVEPPQPGLLWTPGYWGFAGGAYQFNAGYWGPHVGFYGGINYGFGYNGEGFFGGEWRNGGFFYNRAAVANFGGVHVTNVYDRTVIVNRTTVNNYSFNGPRGVEARPTAEQAAFAREQHVQPTPLQTQHAREASQNRALYASQNNGHPAIAATARPNEFSGANVVAAREATMRPAEAAHAGAPTASMARPGGEGRGTRAEPGEGRGTRAEPSEAPHPVAAPNAHTRTGEAPSRPEGEAARPSPAPQTERPHAAPTHEREATAPHEVVRPQSAEPSRRSTGPEHSGAARPEAAAPREVARPEAPRPEPVQRPAAPHVAPAPAPRPVAPPPHAAAPAPAPHAAAPEREHKPQH